MGKQLYAYKPILNQKSAYDSLDLQGIVYLKTFLR